MDTAHDATKEHVTTIGSVYRKCPVSPVSSRNGRYADNNSEGCIQNRFGQLGGS